MGHTGQITLSVLNKPIEIGIECCLAPRHHGPCKRTGGVVKKAARKAVGKSPDKPTAAPAKKAAPKALPKPATPSKPDTKAPTKLGGRAAAELKTLDGKPGWQVNHDRQWAIYHGQDRKGGVEYHGRDGWLAVAPGIEGGRYYDSLANAKKAVINRVGKPKRDFIPARNPFDTHY